VRIDKFLQVSRLVKRRSVARDLCIAGHVQVNGRTVKPGARVDVGDVVSLRSGVDPTVVRVRELRQRASKADSNKLYEVLEQGPTSG